AITEYAMAEAKQVQEITKDKGGTSDFFHDDTAQAWLLEVHNNRPSYTGPSVKRAVDNGAASAANRDAFLDILAKAIVDTYGEMEPGVLYRSALGQKKNKNLNADEKATLKKHFDEVGPAIGRTKGTHTITIMSRHLDI